MLYAIIKQTKKQLDLRKLIQSIIMGVSLFTLCTQVMAQQQVSGGALRVDAEMRDRIQEVKDTKGKGWQLNSQGGLSYINPQDERYWVALNGSIRLDEILYSGSYQDRWSPPFTRFVSSGVIRRLDLSVEGGIGEDWEYSASFLHRGFLPTGGSIVNITPRAFQSSVLEDTFVGYTGFSKNSELFIGRLSANWFGLDGSTGSAWGPFLERSAQQFAFYPGDGLGFMGDMWWEDAAITVVATQRDHRAFVLAPGTDFSPPTSTRTYGNDRWRFVGRITYAPCHTLGDVWHFGVSAAHRRNDPIIDGLLLADFSFNAVPGAAVSRNTRGINRLLNTGGLTVAHVNQWNLEFARQCGPFLAEAEYTKAYARRPFDYTGNVSFNGWNVQARYMLTGEPHVYDVRDGNFGKVDIKSPYGAWEVTARYDFLNLNDKNINGGSQHDITVGLNWFINSQVRASVNYVRMRLHASNMGIVNTVPLRKLNVIGFRLQLRFK